MSKRVTKSILKKKNIEIVDDIKNKNQKRLPVKPPMYETEEDFDYKKKKSIDDDKEFEEDKIETEYNQEEEEEDNFGDDQNEIDDEDKNIDVNSSENEEEVDNDDVTVDIGDEDKGDKDEKVNDEYEDDSCIYNFADERSDDEVELVFDDDVETEKSEIIPPNQRKTKPILFKYERVRILGDRTQQLTLGAKPMIKNTENLTPKQIAELELKNNVIPLIIQRPLPNGKKERWYVKELAH
jgi:DNA-directed RNA polymerase subunit K/omega